KDEVVTPPLSGTILNGATRDSVIELLKQWNVPVRERSVTLAEVIGASKSGELLEIFGSGTAAVISPVGEMATASERILPSGGKVGELTQRLFNEITAIQYG